jgi:hypothetical protein
MGTKRNAVAKEAAPPQPVINDDFSYVSPKDGKTYRLRPKEKLFAESYLTFYGNGVQAIYEAGYKVKDPRVAAAMAYENLTKPHIIAYVNSLLEEYGFNDDNVEKQHLFVLNQYGDLTAKNKAIEMYYKLRGKFAPEKHQHLVMNLTDVIAAKLGRSRPAPNANTQRS